MGEVGERHWAVISERGCEASGLRYDEATELVERLQREGIHGLCIVTSEAASRMSREDALAAAARRRTMTGPRK